MSDLALAPAVVDFRRAFLVNLASSIGGVATRFLLGMLLARLLQPAELGLYAVAATLFGIAQLLRDVGLSAYLQREPELTAQRFSACLGLMAGTTVVATLALLVLAEPLARQFAQPGLAALLQVMALGLLPSAFGSVMAALQLRELAAARIAFVSRIGTLGHAVVALSLSAQGCGALGLAWAQVANACICGLAYACLPSGRSWRPSWRGWGEVLRFGLRALLVSLLSGLNGALPDLWLGRFGSAHLVGLLGRAQALVGLLQALSGHALSFGALPVLASRHASCQSLEPALRHATALLTGLGWPLLALTVAHREALLGLLYGPAWVDCSPAVLPLALMTALGLVFAQLHAALAAIGRPELAALPTGVTLAARLVLGAALFDGSLLSFAWALCAAAAVALPVQLWLAARHLGQSPRALGAALGGSLLATLAVWAVPLVFAPIAWLAAMCWGRHPLLDEALQFMRRRMTSRK
ncbi:oligosaccharide flippase family protein [Paucibacter sp. DJ1R-11]|uniref:oligosaccharide flippase family protein n=1 Tax=Paucibacter sp. DJ1R-11 TaxID=2893556 RepID=UPI0021E36459|nr:oligosaccharide flippase family protein [Paucibacter sp. DJ1R-11]MCV2363466.1 oligosaccharide flippase family protein [Paucibacter sp. DJ1R-11]